MQHTDCEMSFGIGKNLLNTVIVTSANLYQTHMN